MPRGSFGFGCGSSHYAASFQSRGVAAPRDLLLFMYHRPLCFYILSRVGGSRSPTSLSSMPLSRSLECGGGQRVAASTSTIRAHVAVGRCAARAASRIRILSSSDTLIRSISVFVSFIFSPPFVASLYPLCKTLSRCGYLVDGNVCAHICLHNVSHLQHHLRDLAKMVRVLR